jgi:hypothetical protein
VQMLVQGRGEEALFIARLLNSSKNKIVSRSGLQERGTVWELGSSSGT